MSQSNYSKPRLALRELRKRLAALKRLDLERADIEYLKKQLAPILHYYVHPGPLIQPGERIFRAVIWPERPALKAQLTYPPAHFVKAYGRVNRPGEPVFYGSVGSAAAIQELAPAQGARMAVSMWRVTKAMPAVGIGYSERAFAKLGSDRWSRVWWRRPGAEEPIGIHSAENKMLDSFLAREFTRRVPKGSEWQYKLGVAVAEAFLKGKPASIQSLAALERSGLIREGEAIAGLQTPALVYPSIATAANDDNVALTYDSADACLELGWVHYIEILRRTQEPDEFTPRGLDFADHVAPSGEIQWHGTFPNELGPGTDYRLFLEDGALVLKDSLGNIAGKFSHTP